MKIAPYLVGAAPGAALLAIGAHQLTSSHKQALNEMKKDLVSAKETVKQHAPEIYVATSKQDVSASKIPDWQKLVINKVHSNLFSGRNAAYLHGENPMIFSPEKVNRSLLGHEIGHHMDKKRLSILDSILNSRRERRAWESSPFQDIESKRIAKVMAGTYGGGDKMLLGGIAAGVGAVAVPLVMKALKR